MKKLKEILSSRLEELEAERVTLIGDMKTLDVIQREITNILTVVDDLQDSE